MVLQRNRFCACRCANDSCSGSQMNRFPMSNHVHLAAEKELVDWNAICRLECN